MFKLTLDEDQWLDPEVDYSTKSKDDLIRKKKL